MTRGSVTWRDDRQAWQVQVPAASDAQGKRRRITRTVKAPNTTAGRREAEKVRTAMLAEQDAKTVTDSGATVGQCAEAWYERGSRGWSVTTAGEYRRLLDRRMLPRWGRTPLSAVKRGDIMAWHDQLLGEPGLKLPSVRRIHAVLRQVLAFAVDREWLAANPAVGKMLPSEKRSTVKPPSIEDLAAIMERIDDHQPELGAYVRIAAWTGLRRSEMCGLQWRDVDVEAEQLHVRRAVVEDDAGRLHLQGTKTHSERRVGLGPASLAVLEGLRPGKVSAEAFIWSRSLDGSVPWLPHTVSEGWIRHRNALGLSCRLHDLRHWMATQMLADGEAITTVQHRLGHRRASTTLDIYSHAIAARDQAAAVSIERFGAPIPSSDETSTG